MKINQGMIMKKICVYLGANAGNSGEFNKAVTQLGIELVDMGYTLIYGGSSLGMMGLLATTVKDCGGTVIGVITKQLLAKEKPPTILDKLYVVDSMQERKKIMQESAHSFMVMPGGLGTLEEAIDTWDAIKIGVLKKPIGFLNVGGYFDGLFAFINHCECNGFVSMDGVNIPKINSDVRLLLSEIGA